MARIATGRDEAGALPRDRMRARLALVLGFAGLVLAPAPGHAAPCHGPAYTLRVTRVVDGDTVDGDVRLGFGIWLFGQRVRLAGIDAPELKAPDPAPGHAAKNRLIREVGGESVILCAFLDVNGMERRDGFGRVLAVLKRPLGGDRVRNVNVAMVLSGHAAPSWPVKKLRDELRPPESRREAPGSMVYGSSSPRQR